MSHLANRLDGADAPESDTKHQHAVSAQPAAPEAFTAIKPFTAAPISASPATTVTDPSRRSRRRSRSSGAPHDGSTTPGIVAMANFDERLDGHDAPASGITRQSTASALSAPEASAATALHLAVDGVPLDSFESLLEDEQAADESLVPALEGDAGAEAPREQNANRATVAHPGDAAERSGEDGRVRRTSPPNPSNGYLAEMAAAAKKKAESSTTAAAAAAQADRTAVRTRLNGIIRKLASQLSALERAELIARGYECHQTLHRGQKASIANYAKTILAETSIDKRTVQNDVMIATRLSQATRDAIRRTEVARSTRTLIRMAGLGGDDQAMRDEAQATLVAALSRGISAFNAELKARSAERGAPAADPTELAKLVVNVTKRAVDEGLELRDLLEQVRAAWSEVAS